MVMVVMHRLITTLLCPVLVATHVAAAGDRHLEFDVFLDGRHVGTHHFDILRTGNGALTVRSVAAFEVRVLGFMTYRYRHEATERWEQGCLVQIDASTNDNGRALRVTGAMHGGHFALEHNGLSIMRDGCVSSYAYWDSARLLQQRELLNPQTGQFDAAHVESMGEKCLVIGGATVFADQYRLSNGKLVINLWYSKTGEWLQLDSTTPSRRVLNYRLRGEQVSEGGRIDGNRCDE